MKHHKFLLTVVTALGLPALAPAVTLNEAQVTAIVKDVKTIDPAKGSRPALLKETLAGEQSMRTGIESRSELLFNDHTITRLGANTHFSFTEGTRNMSLDSGVMLLQVPKGIGGAKIQTAAVTAAVTGTTIMIEAGKDYTKLIVLEGKCCLWPKNKKLDPNSIQSKLSKMKHEVCALAGQEIILRNGSTDVPPPVYVNLKTLENTSLLLNGNWGAQINYIPINAAADDQGPEDYNPTNLAIVGAGTDVIVITQENPPGLPGTPPGSPGNPANPPVIPPSKYGPLITITSANPYTIGAGSAINTDPRITTNGVTGYGRIYRGDTLDGAANPYFFGATAAAGITDNGLNDLFTNPNSSSYPYFPNYGVAAFKFQNLELSGLPSFDMSTNGANDLALISEGFININAPGVLDFTSFNDVVLATVNGNIDLSPNTTIQGMSGFLDLYTAGANNNITIDGIVNLPNASFFATATGAFSGTGSITAGNVGIKAGGIVTLNENQDEGGTTTDTVNGVQVAYSTSDSDTPLYNLNLTGNEIDVTNGFTATSAYSEGGNFVDLTLNAITGGTFSGNINLSGYFGVDSLTATAANNLTADSTTEINSNNDIFLTALNGDVLFQGTVDNAYDFVASGNNVTLSAGSSVNTSDSVQLNANNNVEVDGLVDIENEGPTFFSATAQNGILLSSSSSITASGTVQLTAGTSIEMDGTVDVTDEGGVLNANGGSVTTGSASSITADNFTITAGGSDVSLDGNINVGTLSISGNNINTLSTFTSSDSIRASNSITFNATTNVTFDGSIITPSLTGTAGNALTVQSTAKIISDNTNFTSNTLVFNGSINGAEGAAAIFFGSTTTGGAGDVTGFGTINAQTISFNSAGDLNLDPVAALPDTVNGISINPYGNLVELDLTGATVELTPSGAFRPSILKATATGGNLTIGSAINVNEFDGTAAGNQIVLNGGTTAITASGTIKLAAAEILNQTGTSGAPVAILTGTAATSLSLSVGANGTLSQTGGASSFTFIQSNTGGVPIASGTIPFMLSGSGSSPTLSVSANSLAVSGTVNASSFSSFALNLTSATGINSGSGATATITAPTSVALQVGVDATLKGDITAKTIDYNGLELIVDTTRLSTFSLGASSILVSSGSSGFPNLPGDLSLSSSGSGGITVNTALKIGGDVTFTAAGGGSLSVNHALTGSNSIMLSANGSGGTVQVAGQLNTSGDLTIMADNGISVTGDLGTISGTVPIGGDANFTSTNGNVSLTSTNVIVAGSLSLNANNGNVTLGNGSSFLSIGGRVTLLASGTVSVAHDVQMHGPLDISAGSDILDTGTSAKFLGATSVTLALTGTGAAISQSTDGTLLNFGGAGDSVANMIGVVLSGSTVTSITASGTSITLSGSFNKAVPLTLNATNGAVTVAGSGTVGASSFTANSANGDIVIGEPLVVTSSFSGIASGGTSNIIINGSVNVPAFSGSAAGNITVNAPVTGFSFSGTASSVVVNSTVTSSFDFEADSTSSTGSISGTGSVSSPHVTLNQSSSATVSQSAVGDDFSFDGLSFTISNSGSSPSVALEAGPLNFNTDLSLPDDILNLSGALNTNGHLISAASVGVESASTVNDTSGNATNLTVSGNSLTLFDDSFEGAVGTHGNGGILSGTALTLGITADYLFLDGGSAGGNGGTVNLTAQQGGINAFDITANGGSGSGNGGTINLTATEGDINAGDLFANGGNASSSTAAGGNGGTINLTAQQGNINVTGNISATSGASGGSKFPGGAGGAVNLVAQGAVNIQDGVTIQVSSSDLVNNVVSATPGNIAVTSHLGAGTTPHAIPAINIASTAQLNSILNQAAVGPGGNITFTADSGGDIVVAGTVRADHGTVNITNSGTASGDISLQGATLSGDIVKAQTLSSNGTLTIGSEGNTRISADTAIKLYAQGTNGTVDFVGNTFLSGNSIKSIAGQTVTINNGVNVNVLGGAATVYTNTANYTGSGGNSSTTGQFTGNTNTTTKPFSSRPAF
ncbi:MAG: FecR domain-containing protein [Chthoniobacteraceae bacterium]